MICKKQTTYKTELGAKIALARLKAKDKDVKRVYYCKEHKGWHTTKMTRG